MPRQAGRLLERLRCERLRRRALLGLSGPIRWQHRGEFADIPPPPEPPPDVGRAPLELLDLVLGAVPVEVGRRPSRAA